MDDASVATSSADNATIERTSLPALAIISLIRAIGALPFGVRSALGAGIGYVVGLFPFREALIARAHFSLFFPELNTKKLTPLVFANLGRSILESFNLKPRITAPFSYVSCGNWDEITSWTKDERPIIALTAHTGNWDLLAAYNIARGIPISTVGKEARNPHFQAALRSLRESYGVDTIWRSDRSGIKRIASCFKERRVMAALIDQDTRVDSVFVPFFGVPAKTPSALIDIGRRFNVRFVTAFMVRTHGTRFEIHAKQIPDGLSTEEILTEYSSRLEQIIRAHPTQWVWFHKRWRTQSDGKTFSTREYLAWLSEQAKR
jgi:KDO2-lipid IV(A) lauroyltransferase